MFWIREFLGWLLIALGLGVFWLAILILLPDNPKLLEAPAFITIGFIIFRGGLHLLKVSVAGQVCLKAHREALPRDRAR